MNIRRCPKCGSKPKLIHAIGGKDHYCYCPNMCWGLVGVRYSEFNGAISHNESTDDNSMYKGWNEFVDHGCRYPVRVDKLYIECDVASKYKSEI